MNLAWFVARAAGLVSWALLTLSMTWGFLLQTRVLGRRPRSKWLLDLHRFLGGLAVVFVGVHLSAILIDTYVPFSPVQLLVPLASEYRPVAVAYGIVAFYLLLAVELTSLLKKHMPVGVWRWIHFVSYPLFVLATVHLLTSGTDSTNLVVRVLAIGALLEATAFVVVRVRSAWLKGARKQEEVASAATDLPPPASWAGATMPSAPPLRDYRSS